MNQSVLLQLVQVPACPNHRDFEMFLEGRIKNICRLAGLGDQEPIVRQARRMLIERYEEQFGKSNLTIWRLCQLTDQNMMKVMLAKKTVHQVSTVMKPVLRIVR
jgi:hypothetical protein